MAEGPINPDREQQRADNNASRRQSGLEPLPKDREDEAGEETREEGTEGAGKAAGEDVGERAGRGGGEAP